MMTSWNKNVIYDVYDTIGGADVGLCHMRFVVKNNTISTWSGRNAVHIKRIEKYS